MNQSYGLPQPNHQVHFWYNGNDVLWITWESPERRRRRIQYLLPERKMNIVISFIQSYQTMIKRPEEFDYRISSIQWLLASNQLHTWMLPNLYPHKIKDVEIAYDETQISSRIHLEVLFQAFQSTSHWIIFTHNRSMNMWI